MKHLFSFIFLLVFSLAAKGQDSLSYKYAYEPYFNEEEGIYGRIGLSRPGTVGWGAEQSKIGRFTSFNFAFGYSHSLTYKGDVSVNGEIGFAEQGFNIKNLTDPEDLEKIRLRYINVPVYLKYYPFPAAKWAYVGAGPQIGFRVSAHAETKGGVTYQLADGDFSNIDLGGIGVAGVHFGHHLNLGMEVRYQHSFSKFLTNAPQIKHSVMQVSVFFPGETLLSVFNFFAYLPIF